MKKGILWGAIFLLIFMISQDNWFRDVETQLGPGGFPSWLYLMVFVQVLFVVAFYLFSKKYWK